MRIVLGITLVVAVFLSDMIAQNQTLSFEVASVRPNGSGENRGYFQVQPGGRVAIANMPLRQIVAFAYGIDFSLIRFSLIGGPGKVLDSRFDIQAVPPSSHEADHPPSRDDSLLMLRAVLADRFGFRIRKETRSTPSYVLTVAKPPKLGPHLRRSEYDCATVRATAKKDPTWVPPRDFDGNTLCVTPYFSSPKPGVITLREIGPMKLIVNRVQAFLDREIVDETGLTGNFEWSVTFSNNPSEIETAPLPIALQSELGLRLEDRTRPAEVYVIDSVTMPTEN